MTLARALTRSQEGGLRIPWPRLGTYVQPMQGQFVIIAADPGVGKSVFALNWILRSQHRTTLLSLDTDFGTQALRTAAILTGTPIAEVSQNPSEWAKWLHEQHLPMRAYEVRLTPPELGELMEAEAEYWGVMPEMLVIDNLGDIATEGMYESYRQVMLAARDLARRTKVCVVGLHHLRDRQFPNKPPKLRDLQYAGKKEAEIVLGLHGAGDTIEVGVLKNRAGWADPAGDLRIRMNFDKRSMRIQEAGNE